jgi:hypothetical protein
MQLDGHISSVLHDDVRHVREENWLPEVLMAANAEMRLSVREHLNTTQSSDVNNCTTITRTLEDHVNRAAWQVGRCSL